MPTTIESNGHASAVFTFIKSMTRAELDAEKKRALAAMANGEIDVDLYQELDAEYTKVVELQAAVQSGPTGLRIKHHAKGEKYKDSKGVERVGTGVVSVYIGGARFPQSLYATQWQYLLEGCEGPQARAILAYIEKHRATLSWSRS